MQRLLGFVLDKFSELGPVRKLFKFLFGRIFDNLIDREIKLSDFKNNILELENLPLSTQKINKVYLSDSPYKLHSGVIGKLKIKIASFKELTTKDIEVQVDKIHLVFNFNTNYHKQKNFQMNQNSNEQESLTEDIDLKEEDEDEEEYEQQNGQNQQKQGKQDMFKQFIRQVLSNIKLSVTDLVVDMYMNEPTIPKQAYVMLRMKKLKIYQQKKELIHKKLKVQKDKSENLYWIKLKEISAYIIKPNEEQSSMKEFPFNYPGINDMQCIFTTSFKMKQFKSAYQSQDKKAIDSLNQSYLFDYNQSMIERDIKNQNLDDEAFLPNHLQIETLFNPNDATVKSVKVYIPPIEVQLDPIQLKVLLNFSNQFSSYQKMRKINDYKKNNFCQKDIHLYNMMPKQNKQKHHPKKQDEEDFEQNNVIINQQNIKSDHFKIQKDLQLNNNQQSLDSIDSRQDSKEDQNNSNLNKNLNSSQNEEVNVFQEIQFDFFKTQFDFKVYAINLFLLKKEIKLDANKTIIQNFNSQSSNDNDYNNKFLYSRNWIYYYDELNEKVFNQLQQPSQNPRLIHGISQKNKDSSAVISNTFIERTSFNDGIPCSYFLFQLKGFKILTNSKVKKTITLKSIKLLDVNLIENCGIYSEIQLQQKSNNTNPANQSQGQSSQNLPAGKNYQIVENSNDIFQSFRGGETLQKEQSFRESMQYKDNINDSVIFKSMNNDNEDLFYSMNENQFAQSSFGQSNRNMSQLEKIVEEEVDSKKQILSLKNWRINPEHQHFCITYILLIKGNKNSLPQQKNQQNISLSTNSRVSFKQDILYKSNWMVEENKNREQYSQQSALKLELLQSGSVIDGQAIMNDIYLSFDLRILRDMYHIQYPCEDWGKFVQKYHVYDSKLQNTDNISLLEDYSKQCDEIEKYMKIKSQSQQSNQNKKPEGDQKSKEEILIIKFSLQIDKLKCAFLSYQEKGDFKSILSKYEINNNTSEISFNNQTCFCSHLIKETRNNKKYLSENIAIQFDNFKLDYINKPDQPFDIKFSLGKTTIGLLKINKNLSLDSVEPIFKFTNLLDIESITLNLILLTQSQKRELNQNYLNFIHLSIGSLQINVWNIEKIMSLVNSTQNLLEKYQDLLEILKKLDREEQRRTSKLLTEKDKQNEEVKSEDGGDDMSQELGLQFSSQLIKQDISQERINALNEFDISFNINKVDVRVIYLKNFKNECYERKNASSQIISDASKNNLFSYIFKQQNYLSKLPLQQQSQIQAIQSSKISQQQLGDKKYIPYEAIQNQIIPLNSCIQFILRHNSLRLEKGSKIALKIYEIYLIDHMQTKINLGNYKKYSSTEDLSYNNYIQLSSDSQVEVNKLLIYSTSYYDPKLIEEEEQNKQSQMNNNNSNIIDLDQPSRRRSSLNEDNSRGNQRFSSQQQQNKTIINPVIYIKASYLVNVESKSLNNESPKKVIQNNPSQEVQDINNKEEINLDTSVLSEDGNMQDIQAEKTVKKTTVRITFSKVAIQDFIIRFGDFRSEIIGNLLDLSKVLSQEQELQAIDEIEKKQNQSDHIKKEMLQSTQPQQKQGQNDISGVNLQIKNLVINNIAIDLFPFHDQGIRNKLPKVYQNIANENQSRAFYTNQRSMLLLRNISLKNLKYVSYPNIESLELKLSIKGLDLYTLIFDDYKHHINPLVLCRQNHVFKDIHSLESQLHLDNKSYDFVNQIEELGFQNIIELSSEIQFTQTKDLFKVDKYISTLDLQIQKFTLTSCKDSILAFPLHITLLSLLFQRFADSLTKEEPSPNQQQQSNSKNSSIHQNNNNNQSQSPPQNINANGSGQPNNQQQKKDDFDFDDDFEQIGEEFLTEENDNKLFIQNAKHQSIEYFHKLNLDDQIPFTHYDFTILKLEIQIFSGKDFDFEQKQKIQSQRKRNSIRDSKQNLLLLFNQIRVLYSEYPATKKINLSIHSLDLQGTVGNQAKQIIKKKEEQLQLLLLDITIDEVKKLISLRTYLAKIKVIIDKMHKTLFEDLSQMHINLEEIAVNKEIKEDANEAYIFNNISKIRNVQQQDNYQEIQLSDNQNEEQKQEIDEDDDDFEIFDGEQNQENQADDVYKLSLIQIGPIELEVTVNWFVNSILKDSLLKFDEFYDSKEKGMIFDENLIFQLQNHYTKIFDVHIMKNNQLLQIVKDVVLIRNITNITKSLANVFILPYKSFKNNERITSGLLAGVKGFQQSIFTETKNFLSVVSSVYSSYIKSNIMKITKIKKLLKNKKPK